MTFSFHQRLVMDWAGSMAQLRLGLPRLQPSVSCIIDCTSDIKDVTDVTDCTKRKEKVTQL